jgi:uncharacterized protein
MSLAELSFPSLTEPRTKVLAGLARLSAHDDALEQLGVGASLAAEVARNTRLEQEPAAPAYRVYSGVLYDALNYRGLTSTQRRKANDAVVVVSGLWGAIGFADRIPAYRLSMAVALPGLGRLASFWKPHLSSALAEAAEGHLLVDCRSSSYAAAWAPPPGQTVAVNVFTEQDGKRTVVSHFAKHTRGELARHLLSRRGKAPETPEQLLKATKEHWRAELVSAEGRRPSALNIVLEG